MTETVVYNIRTIYLLFYICPAGDIDWSVFCFKVCFGQVLSHNAKAQQLQTAISGKCGFELAIVAGDESTPQAFILSDSKPEVSGVHSMHVEDNRLIIRSSASTGIAGCVQRFIDLYFSYGARGKYNFPGDFEYLDLGDYMIVTYPDAG